MNIKTRAIVLHLQRVSDKSSILHLYTRENGRMAYFIYGSPRKKSSVSTMQMPLSLIDIDAVHLDTREIQQLRDMTPAFVPCRLPSDIVRQTVALFIAEVLYRTLTHPMADPQLFDFVEATIRRLDETDIPERIHLDFLVGYIEYLGFAIDFDDPANLVFRQFLSAAPLTLSQRRLLLSELMSYYQRHLPDFQLPKSLDVMSQVFA